MIQYGQLKLIKSGYGMNIQKVEVKIAMRYKRIEHFSDHLQSNFHK